MKTQNSVQLIGYLGQDPVMRTAVNGSKLARFTVATDHFHRIHDGTIVQKVTWHEILAWNLLAEKVPGNFIKGSHVLVRGELRKRNFKTKDGEIRSITEVCALELLNLDR